MEHKRRGREDGVIWKIQVSYFECVALWKSFVTIVTDMITSLFMYCHHMFFETSRLNQFLALWAVDIFCRNHQFFVNKTNMPIHVWKVRKSFSTMYTFMFHHFFVNCSNMFLEGKRAWQGFVAEFTNQFIWFFMDVLSMLW